MTIYKMWPSKGALTLAGYFATVKPTLAFPAPLLFDRWSRLMVELAV